VLAGGGRGWVPGPDLEVDDAPAELPGPTPPPAADEPSGPGPDSSWQRLRGPAGTGPRDVPLEPAVLSRLRLDPGRRGAAALVVVALVAALAAGAVVLRGRPQEVAAPDVVAGGAPLPGPTATASPGPEAADVVVAVAGKVVRPGLVRLPAGSRVDDAVRAAGGPLPGTDPGLLNLARRLVDGEQVLVGVDPPPAAPGAPGAGPSPGGLLDLNRATAAELDALPGIGPVLAQRIVDWRTEHGRFASIEQLREVTGIGESKYAELEDSVSVS
jgi:competence protein ComEA